MSQDQNAPAAGPDTLPGRFIRHAASLAPGSAVLIYGAGGRGRTFLRQVRAAGEGRRVLGFVDSFKSGRESGLPVHVVSALPGLIEELRPVTPVIVIASAFHRAISRQLQGLGLGGYRILLDPDEGVPCADLDESEVLAGLNATRHPIGRVPADTTPRNGRVWRCSDLSALYLRPTGLSLCCWMQDLSGADDPAAALQRLNRLRKIITQGLDDNNCAFCAACPSLAQVEDSGPREGLTCLHMDVSVKCNLRCSYCNVQGTHKNCLYDPVALLALLRRDGRLRTPYAFDWGGFGEPSINPDFGPMTGAMLDDGASGLIYTNALVRHAVIERGLAEDRLTIVCSVDAGTRATYAAVRNVDAFETVWANLKAYAAINAAKVSAKYIVTLDNCGTNEVRAFAERCLEAGVRHVIIAKDFFAKRTRAAVREGVRALALECRQAGLDILFLPTAISPSFIRSLRLPASK